MHNGVTAASSGLARDSNDGPMTADQSGPQSGAKTAKMPISHSMPKRGQARVTSMQKISRCRRRWGTAPLDGRPLFLFNLADTCIAANIARVAVSLQVKSPFSIKCVPIESVDK